MTVKKRYFRSATHHNGLNDLKYHPHQQSLIKRPELWGKKQSSWRKKKIKNKEQWNLLDAWSWDYPVLFFSFLKDKDKLYLGHAVIHSASYKEMYLSKIAKVCCKEEVSNIVSMTTQPSPYFIWQSCTFRFISFSISSVLVRFISGLRYKPVGLLMTAFTSNFRKYEAL